MEQIIEKLDNKYEVCIYVCIYIEWSFEEGKTFSFFYSEA